MGTQILTALLVGLLTAFAFQLLLTSIGVTIGITVLGFRFAAPVDAEGSAAVELIDPGNAGVEKSAGGSTAKISTLAGLGVLTTSNLVLFGACFLATKFSQITDPASGAIAGVVIWSAYFLILTWVSSTAISAFIGSVLSSATGGFRQLIQTVTAAFRGQDDTPLTQEKAIAIMRQEIQDAFNPVALDDLVQASFNRHLALTQATQTHGVVNQSLLQQTQRLTEQLQQLPDLEPEEAAQITVGLQRLANISQRQVKATAQSATTANTQLWQKFEAYLRYTSGKRLTLEGVQQKLTDLLTEALASSPSLHAAEFERDRFNQVLKRRKGVNKKQRQQLLQHIETTWNQLIEQYALDSQTTATAAEPSSPLESLQPLATYITESLQQLGDQLPTDEINLESLREHLPELLSVSSVGAWVLMQRLSRIDWETLAERLPLQDLNDEQIEQVVTEVKSTAQEWVSKPQQWTEDYLLPQTQDLKNQVLQRVEQFQQAIQRRVDALKAQAQQQLESTRKAAIAAAWWLSATAFTTAIAAAIAGALATGISLPYVNL